MKSLVSRIKSFPTLIKKHWKLSLILIIILVGIGGWRIKSANSAQDKLTFQPVVRASLTKSLDISGVVDAKEKARLKFLAGGKLVFLGAQEGEWVKKWQTIASIDKKALQTQLDQDLNNYLKERWDFEDSQDSYDYNVENKTTRRTLDKEQWDLENTVSTVEYRDAVLKETSLYSPFAGVLIKSPANVTGVQLLATDVFEIVNPQSLIFKAEVDEADIANITLGQKATIELDAYESETLNTQLSYIAYSSTISSAGTVFLVEFPLNSEDLNKYRIGMNGDAKIILDTRENVLVVPYDSTISREGKYFVKVKGANNQPEEREVTIGLETDDQVEILSGLSENDLVLLPE